MALFQREEVFHFLDCLSGNDGGRELDELLPDVSCGQVQGVGVEVIFLLLKQLFSRLASDVHGSRESRQDSRRD